MDSYMVLRAKSLEEVAEYLNEIQIYKVVYIDRKQDDFHGTYYEALLKVEGHA